ncbi:MAG: macro domain-containing protein [Erysipelotrichaceae bacterium]|nr:macro domain-containing protein [Erysipelotrichaceae bacterium]
MPLSIIHGDITEQKCDAIVNAANTWLQAGGGVCGAIFEKAGRQQLQQLCDQIGGCPTGSAVYTDGLQLCRYIIHAVGPVYQDGEHGEPEQLYSTYASSLDLAEQLKIESIAFPLISSGIYGYPRDEALQIAVKAIGDHLEKSDLDVRLMIYDEPSGYLKWQQRQMLSFWHKRQDEETTARRKVMSDLKQMESQQSFAFTGFAMAPAEESKRREPAYQSNITDSDLSLDSAEGFRQPEDSFSTALLKLIDQRQMLDPDVYRRANLDRKLFSKIRTDASYQPSRNTAIALAIALKLSLDEANELLEKAGYRIGHSSMFDIIVEHCFLNGIYNIHEVNELLFVNDQKTLGSYGD